VHSLPSVHEDPSDFRAAQAPEAQYAPAAQSASFMQPDWQPEVVHTACLQSVAVATWQVPPPQVRAGVNMAPAQAAIAHTVVESYLRQPPLPSQVPSRPHISGGSLAQSVPDGLPDRTGWQLPLAWPVRDSVHAMQAPAQAVWQQTPSTQKDDEHSFAAKHDSPLVFLVLHVPTEQ